MSSRALLLTVPALVLVLVPVLACSFRRQPPPGAPGDEIYRLQNCANCHGEAREGTRLGPPLGEVARHWDVEHLAAFLADPRPVVEGDGRLGAYRATYGSSRMGPYDNLDLDQRRTLAAWLLANGGGR